MAKRQTMDPIECDNPSKKGTRLFIPGGWSAFIPKVEPDMETLIAFSRYHEQSVGPMRARQLTLESIQRVFDGAYIHLLKLALKKRVQRYAKMYPALLEEVAPPTKRHRGRYFQAKGFDPEVIQATFVPSGNQSQVDKDLIEAHLREMGTQTLKAR